MSAGAGRGPVLGPLLRGHRVAAGLTQEELAQRSGLSVRALSDLERGHTTRPFIRTIRLLADALGLGEPARAQLMAVLREGTAGEVPGSPGGSGGHGPRPVVPRQLPASVRRFTGRAGELTALHGLLAETADAGGTVVISAIGGMAGVGKTALAVHWAHQVAGAFPDGQLHVNLRGFDPAEAPLVPGEVILGFLESLQVPAGAIPSGLDARAALYRSLLAGRKMLVLLDNARDSAQVRPLLPGSPGCLVVVTSRNPLTGLAAAEGAHLLSLAPLAEAEAHELLAARLGHQRAVREEQAAGEVIELCARLPLALVIATARAAAGHGITLATLAAELRAAPSRLDALDIPGGRDPADSVRAVFWSSYRTLSQAASRMFRLLGLHPGPDITCRAAASLAAVAPGQARRVLGELTAAQLLTEHTSSRFAFHDLLRAYAAEQARAYESKAGRRAALHRVLDHYLHTAHSAGLLLYPTCEHMTLAPCAPGTAPERFASYRDALAWFLAEQQVLAAVVRTAADWGFDTHAWQLPAVLQEFFARRGDWHHWARTGRIALAAAQRLGDQVAQARAHRSLGDVHIPLAAYQDADHHLQHALNLYRGLGDQAGEGGCLFSLARVCEERGDYHQALHHAGQALRLWRGTGNKLGQAWALNTIGWLHTLLGDHQLALSYCQSALSMHRAEGNRFGQATTLDSLAYTHHQAGRHAHAAALYHKAVTLYRQVGDQYYQAITLIHLGDAQHAAGNNDAARQTWNQAQAILTGLHHPRAAQTHARLQHPTRTARHSRVLDH